MEQRTRTRQTMDEDPRRSRGQSRSRRVVRPPQSNPGALVAYNPVHAQDPRVSSSRNERPTRRTRPAGEGQLVVHKSMREKLTQKIQRVSNEPKHGRGQNSIRTGDVRKIYKVLPTVIGTGSFGTVRACIHRENRSKLAIKSILIKGKAANSTLLKNEIALLQQVNHRNVVSVVDVIQDREYIHIIMEQCKGGDLFDMTVDGKVRLGEGKIRTIVTSLLDAIVYLHDRNIVHRDLKAEHLMFSKDDIKSPIKIIDFGVACYHKPGDVPLTAFAGSLRSVAPEVVKRSYGKECDLWSCGVITYFLLMQQMPFDSPTGDSKEVFAKIVSGRFFYPQWAATGLSEHVKDFIDRLIEVNPRKRLTAKQALSHPWIRNKEMKQQQHSGRKLRPTVKTKSLQRVR